MPLESSTPSLVGVATPPGGGAGSQSPICTLGDYRHALHYHRMELSLSEACGDQLGSAIANRKVGECECELGNYSAAIQHQTEHLKTARGLGMCTPA